MARAFLGDVEKGLDPAEEKTQRRQDVTVAQLCERYLAEGTAIKKASTLATDRGRIERHIVPLLGRRKVREVTRSDIERFLQDVAVGKTRADIRTGPRGRAIVEGGKGTATRTLGLLGGIFSFAVKNGLRPDNPVHGVKRFADRKGERFLSPAELACLGRSLMMAEQDGANPTAIGAIRLLALTGCRKSEILSLQWEHVDLERGCLRLPDSKTGAKVVYLGDAAIEVLKQLPRVSRFVLPGDGSKGHLADLSRVWERVKEQATVLVWLTDPELTDIIEQLHSWDRSPPRFSDAIKLLHKSRPRADFPKGLMDVRLHDLRHSFASMGVSTGDSLVIIGALLGHRDAATTARYAHLADHPARAAADRISGQIATAMRAKINP